MPHTTAKEAKLSFFHTEIAAQMTEQPHPTSEPTANGIMNPTPIQSLSRCGDNNPTAIPMAVVASGQRMEPSHHLPWMSGVSVLTSYSEQCDSPQLN